MKLINGILLPNYETHLVEHLGLPQNPKFAGKGTYQFPKFAACFPLIKKFDHAVDVGGHCGLWSRVFERCFDRVTAFEPVPAHRECFNGNVPHRDGVTLHPYCLGDKPGTVRLNAHQSVSAKSKILAGVGSTGDTHVSPNGDLDAEVRTLASFDLIDVDFLKIDVEGYEKFVVQGGEQMIRRDKPAIIVEQKPGHAERYGLKQTEAVKLLQDWGAELVREIHGDFILRWN